MPGAAALKHRLTFHSPTAASDESGNAYEGWTAHWTISARIQPLRGGEHVMAARLAGRQPVLIQVYNETRTRQIRTDWRAVAEDGTSYNLRSITPDERGRFIDILAEAGVG